MLDLVVNPEDIFSQIGSYIPVSVMVLGWSGEGAGWWGKGYDTYLSLSLGKFCVTIGSYVVMVLGWT